MKKVAIGIVVLLLLAQIYQPPKNQVDDPAKELKTIQQNLNIPDAAMQVLKPACFDCHSNHTRYLWYANITPVNWWMYDHIRVGKSELNFAEMHAYNPKKKHHKYEEIADEVVEEHMPLKSYLKTHADARLTDEQKREVIDWAKRQMQ